MLNIYTSTFCRPDYVQLLADAIAVTAREDYRFVVVVQPDGLRREWRNVHEVVDGRTRGYGSWRDATAMIGLGSRGLVIHDDCVPVLPWSSEMFGDQSVTRRGGHTIHYYHDGYRMPSPQIAATRVRETTDCADRWSGELCKAASDAYAEAMMDGTFLHIDKGTIGSLSCGANEHKPALVEAICNELGIERPEDLTRAEMASHPGKNIRSPRQVAASGLGDIVKAGLSAVGITEERVSKAIGRPCGCGKRAAAMNQFGAKYLGLPPGSTG